MSKKSQYTKNLRTKIIVARVFDAIILVTPLIVFFVLGLMNDEALVIEKVCLVGSTMLALVLVIVNILAKTHLRSAIWLVVIGLYLTVDNLMPLIITLAVTTIIDEFVLEPCIKHWHTKYLASNVMDERGIE